MTERIQKTKTTTTREDVDVAETKPSTERGEALKADIDDLLDEIDEVLETNAEEFVKGYVQKGGQ
jgi:prokaryotic ubiquitin-like protein Pup